MHTHFLESRDKILIVGHVFRERRGCWGLEIIPSVPHEVRQGYLLRHLASFIFLASNNSHISAKQIAEDFPLQTTIVFFKMASILFW